MLTNLATALNECVAAGLSVRLKHNAVYTSAGYVLPIDEAGRWVARTLLYTELAPASDDPDDE